MKRKNAGENHLLLAALESGEALLDTLVSSEVAKAIPVVSAAVGILRTVDDMRSIALKAKLLRFITDESLRDSVGAQKIRKRLEQDEDAEELGGILFLTLDKVTDLKKPVLLAKVFAAYLDARIERNVLLLLAHSIDIAFAGDLEHFIETLGSPSIDDTLAVYCLANAGLFQSYVTGAIGGGDVQYQISPLGSSLLHALGLGQE